MKGPNVAARGSIIGALVLGMLASAAAAQTRLTGPSAGHTYFNRAGATIEEHDGAVRACQRIVRDLRFNRRTTTPRDDSEGAALAAVIADTSSNIQSSRRTFTAGVENCMVVRGWRVVRVARDRGAALDRLSATDIRIQLTPLVGAETPDGEVVRIFNNDMQFEDTIWTGPPRNLDVVSLSIQALDASPGVSHQNATLPPAPPRTAAEPMPRRPRDAMRFPAGETVLVLQVQGAASTITNTFRFDRIGADPSMPAWMADGLPSGFDVPLDGRRQTLAVRVPPGRWRITSITQTSAFDGGVYTMSFCLGAPSFDIASGEAVYAGFFSEFQALLPNLDMAHAQAALAVAPDVAGRLRPASYVNGATFPCDGTYIYALEIPGASFEDGYNAGSNYRSAPADTAVSSTSDPQRAEPMP